MTPSLFLRILLAAVLYAAGVAFTWRDIDNRVKHDPKQGGRHD
jgi:hypothetical protein